MDAIHPSTAEGYILTAASKRFYFRHPKPEDFDITVIAHALAQIPRFGGHGKFPYSVAQHSVECARVAWERWRDPVRALTMLLHDGSEAMGLIDLPRPIKVQLEGYMEAEEVVQRALAEAHGTIYPLPDELKLIDNRMLITEAVKLFDPPTDTMPWWIEDGWPPPYAEYTPVVEVPWRIVASLFHNTYTWLDALRKA